MSHDRLRELAAFDGYLRKRRDPATVQKYIPVVTQFLLWLGARRPGALTLAQLDAYFDEWYELFEARHGRRPAPATHRAQITALKAFFRFLELRDFLIDESGQEVRNRMALLESPARERKPIDYLTAEETEVLLERRGAPHEELIVWLLHQTGIRIGELRDLRVGDIDLRQPGRETLRIRISKTPAGRRTVPLPPELVLVLQRWFNHLKASGLYHLHGPVLPTTKGTPAASQWIDRVLKRSAEAAGVRVTHCTCGTHTVMGHDDGCPRGFWGNRRSELTAHTLRRTYATDLINQGMRIESISKLLGHTSVAITQEAYAELLDPEVRDEFNRVRGFRVAA